MPNVMVLSEFVEACQQFRWSVSITCTCSTYLLRFRHRLDSGITLKGTEPGWACPWREEEQMRLSRRGARIR